MRVPARFELRGGALSPPTISLPAKLPVEVTVVSSDGVARRVTLGTHPSRTLAVAGHGRASVLLHGLRRGAYRLSVSGGAYATLVIGSEPGP